MRTAKRIITASLTAIMIFQGLAPSTEVFAQELDALQDTAVATAYAARDAAQSVQKAAGSLSLQGADEQEAVAGDDASAGGTDAGAEGGSDAAAGDNTATGGAETDSSTTDGATDDANDGSSADTSGDQDDAVADNATADEAAEQDADAAAESEGFQYATVEDLNKALNDADAGSATSSDEAKATEVNLQGPKGLAILSHADPTVYQDASITLTGTGGTWDMTDTNLGVTFEGLGSKDVPFVGTANFATGQAKVEFKTSHTFYNGITLNGDNCDLSIAWAGSASDPIAASNATGNGQTFSVAVKVALTDGNNVKLTSPLFGDVDGDMTVDAAYTVDSNKKIKTEISTAEGNIGLLANTVHDGVLTIEQFKGLPDNGLDGSQTIKATGAGYSAGALIGEATGETIFVNTSIDLSSFDVQGAYASGGFVGKAEKLTLQFGDGGSVNPALKVGSASSVYSGGAFGRVTFAADPNLGATSFVFDSAVELGARKRAGGLFGCLDVTTCDVTINGGTYKSKLVAGVDDSQNRGSYGGIAGIVCSASNEAVHALKVTREDEAAANSEIERASNLCYVGGVVGYLGTNSKDGSDGATVAAVLDGAKVVINGNAFAYNDNGKLGGAVGVVDSGDVLDVRDFKLSSVNEIGKQNGGSAGIAGSAWEGVIRFSGTTDLSGAKFADTNRAAQLVFQNSNSLIFATGNGSDDGWTLIRSNEASPVDDIFDYGEVIRLGGSGKLSKNLITLDSDAHTLKFSASLKKTDGVFNLSSEDDFAKLAITWQTSGRFSIVENVDSNNFQQSFRYATIDASNNVDLSGTGLMGLTKDPANGLSWTDSSDNWTFNGTLKGTGAIKLAVGEPYGKRDGKKLDANDESDGNGKIYRHSRLGLFAIVGEGAKVEGVTVAGTMRFDNRNDVDAGSFAAERAGGSVSVSGAIFKTEIIYDNTDASKSLGVGEIIGKVTGGDAITFDGGTKVASPGGEKANITARLSDAGNSYVGGAIGWVDGASTVEINAKDLIIGGSISVPSYQKVALVGGFIGYIRQGDAKKTVNITGLSYNSYSQSVGKDKAGNTTAGGLLGYSWGNTDVTIGGDNQAEYALKTSSAAVEAPTATEFGGLIYAASGHWTIANKALDLSDTKLTANNAQKFGVLVCRGGSAKTDEKIGIDELIGLYLENTAYWEDAYKVKNSDKSIAISARSATTFDEWIADACRTGLTVEDCGKNGVVSLHTSGEKLDMSGDSAMRNSYTNRTTFGENKKTNSSTRYYYNLDRAKTEVKKIGTDKLINSEDNWINKPEELLLWSARAYAAEGIKNDIWEIDADSGDGAVGAGSLLSSNKTVRIGSGNSSDKIDLDLKGYSYYPVDVAGVNVDVKNCTLKFYFSDIKEEEADNKPNSEQTQHMDMHAGFLRDFEPSKEEDRTLTIYNLTLEGTVGSAKGEDGKYTNGGTGALICGDAYGSDSTGKGRSMISIQGLKLAGISVDGADSGDYAPLLINNMSTYAGLTVKGYKSGVNFIQGISVKDNSYGENPKLASSLFGKLGNKGGVMVSASLSDITVPSLNSKGFFTHASFFESFAYQEGSSGSSANYIFYSQKHEEEEPGFIYKEPTYGSEIDAAEDHNEYKEKQLWYYDQLDYGEDAKLVTDGQGRKASKTNPAFGDYLPYVYNSTDDSTRSHKSFHEIKVNQRVANLEKGCGTYSDPFKLSNEAEVNAVSEYINNESSVLNDWEITVIDNQENICTRRAQDGSTDHECVYIYQQGQWIAKNGSSETISNDTMHRYLQSAYYSIEPANTKSHSIELDSFKGFGNKTNPFRGVIVGDLDKGSKGIVIDMDKSQVQGLVPYSYGSVIKNLTVTYKGSAGTGVKYDTPDSETKVPKSFFGGVIGCIMGGDNIIDGVTVKTDGGFSIAGSGDKGHLVPVGGYIGTIVGGGVIFRGMNGITSWRASTKENNELYDNPFVGRVIDGYAFSEDCTVDNGNANYKVNKLVNNGTVCVTTNDDLYKSYRSPAIWDDGVSRQSEKAATVEIENAQGMLVLSAIINSGAAAGPTGSKWLQEGSFLGSKAYEGRIHSEYDSAAYKFGNDQYGKVRNADYDQVGKGTVDDDEWNAVKSDDTLAPGNKNEQGPLEGTDEQNEAGDINSPYLVRTYSNWRTGYICAAGLTGINLKLKEGASYNLDGYGTGYLGLSGRYYANACVVSDKSDYDRRRITPAVACIDGNNAAITANVATEEYTDDDYKISGVGVLFSNVMFTSQYVGESMAANDNATVTDLKFNHCSVSLAYVDSGGNKTNVLPDGREQVGVGCIAGVTSNMNTQESYGVYKNVHLIGCNIDSPAHAGGLYGSAGYMQMRTASDDNDAARMVDYNWENRGNVKAPLKLLDCTYASCDIFAPGNVGGFVGKMQTDTCSLDVSGTGEIAVGLDTTIRGGAGVGNDSTTVGGIIGLSGASVNVGEKTDPSTKIVVKNLTATTDGLADNEKYLTRGVGGIVGFAELGSVSVSHFQLDADTDPTTASASSAGNMPYLGSRRAALRANNIRYMDVGGVVGCSKYADVTIKDVYIKNIDIVAREYCGAVVGEIKNDASLTLDIDGATVESSKIEGAYSGGVVGATPSNSTVKIANTAVKNTTFAQSYSWWPHDSRGSRSYSGAISGDTKGTVSMANILISENVFQDNKNYHGLLVGEINTALNKLYVAGVSVRLKEGQTRDDVPDIVQYEVPGDAAKVNKKCYIAFADYNDTFDGTAGSALYDDKNDDATAVAPYVTTSPVNNDITVDVNKKTTADDGTETTTFIAKNLYGDGSTVSKAATIKSQAGTSVANTFTYDNIDGCIDGVRSHEKNSYNDKTSESTFLANNTTVDAAEKPATDFDVLLIPGNDTTTVTNYLNIVTNGGFSDAVQQNTGKEGGEFVTAKAETFTYDSVNKRFVKDETATSTLSVDNNGAKGMSFRASTDWDNEKCRFTLLTVTFNDGAKHEYKVQVPVIVKRMLEINFSATYTYGSSFKQSRFADNSKNYNAQGYAGYTDHVLVSSGEDMTGYLTWTYNQAGNTKTEYGWNTHLASGGSMGPLNKQIVFEGNGDAGKMPAGTQLTLVDVAHDNRYYTYTVGDAPISTVKLSDFKHGNEPYEELWLSEIMGVQASKPSNTGAWIKMTDDEVKEHKEKGDLSDVAGAKIDSDYYCKADENTPSGRDRYTLTVSNEDPKSESFYLIVRTPSGPNAVNGKTTTSVSAAVNTHINQVWPDKDCSPDSGVNTASTYSINSSYRQELVDNTVTGTKQMATDAAPSDVFLDVTDTIRFDKKQQYGESDSLFFQFESSLVNYGKNNSGATGYPVGTTGTVKFYVKVGETPYKWEDGKWVSAGENEAAVPAIELPDDGKDLSIPLATVDGDGNYVPIDLKELRKKASAVDATAEALPITITVKSEDMKMSYNACQMGISATPTASATADTLSKWTQTSYRGCLSTHAETLFTSSMTATHPGFMQYYRVGNDGKSTISLDAPSKAQLGINVDDLDSADGTIVLTSKYDFSGLHDNGAKLTQGEKVTYTFTLEQRQDDDDGSYKVIEGDLSSYISSITSDKLGAGKLEGNKIVFTDTKQGDTARFGTQSASETLADRFTVKVNTDIEKRVLRYANYRIVLTAHLSGGGVEDDPDNAQLLAGYNEKHSDYVTYTITKIKTEGVDHKG